MMGEHIVILCGFIVTEVAFDRFEHWWAHHADGFRKARHTAIVFWVLHPNVQAGLAHFINHHLSSVAARVLG